MKKNQQKHVRSAGVLLAVLFFVSGCGANKTAQPAVDPNADSSGVTATENGAESKGSVDRYLAFIDGSEPIYFDRENLEVYNLDTGKQEGVFETDTPYTRKQFISALDSHNTEYWGDTFKIRTASYAMIDCGDDGVPEMLLRLWGNSDTIQLAHTLIVKEIGERLTVCAFFDDADRSYTSVNEYGMISSGGPSGYASSGFEHYYVDATGEKQFLYYEGTEFCGVNLYSPDAQYGAYEFAEELGIADTFDVEYYHFEKMGENDDYDEYVRNGMYCLTTPFEGSVGEESFYQEEGPYRQLRDFVNLNFVTTKEADTKIAEVCDAAGCSEKIRKGEEIEHMIGIPGYETEVRGEESEAHLDAGTAVSLPDYGFEIAKGCFRISNPSWSYYADEDAAAANSSEGIGIGLEQISAVPNEITDDQNWFSEIGEDAYSGTDFSDGTFYYGVTRKNDANCVLEIYDESTGNLIAELDFGEYVIPPLIAAGDEDFVSEEISFAAHVFDILYVGISHRTYASSAPSNAYVVALDMARDYKVLWKSDPLVNNSRNFAIVEDAIVCGYGFTNEPDYLYILNRFTGRREAQIPVKTGPDYMYYKNDRLYVRTYDTNYIFDVVRT